ncbi:MAG: ABC transporter permease [Coprococcus sp.]
MFGRYIKSEQRKILYNKWILIVIICMLVFIPAMVLSLNAFAEENDYFLIKSKLMQSFYLGQVGYVVFSALYFGQEYLKSTLRTSLLSIPKRMLFLMLKVCCILIWTVIVLIITSALSIVVVHISLDVSLTTDYIVSCLKCLIPAYISTIELVLITAGITIITHSPILSIAIIISLILGLGNLMLQYSTIIRFFPVISSMNGFLVEKIPQYLTIVNGLIVQGIWCVGLFGIAAILFQKRYVR